MEHWDAWLAEDVLREAAADPAKKDEEGGEEKDASSSSSTIVGLQSQPKVKKTAAVAKRKVKKKMSNLEKRAAEISPPSPTVWTPPRDLSQMEGTSLEEGKERPRKERIFLRRMLDEKIPIGELLEMDMPDILKNELRDWDAKFPNLTVFGKAVGKSPELEEREQLRRMLACQLVEAHLWPEIQTVLSTKGPKKGGDNNQQKGAAASGLELFLQPAEVMNFEPKGTISPRKKVAASKKTKKKVAATVVVSSPRRGRPIGGVAATTGTTTIATTSVKLPTIQRKKI